MVFVHPELVGQGAIGVEQIILWDQVFGVLEDERLLNVDLALFRNLVKPPYASNYIIEEAFLLRLRLILINLQSPLPCFNCHHEVFTLTTDIELFFHFGLESAQILPHYDIVFF